MDVLLGAKLTSPFGCMLIVKESTADKLGMCLNLSEGVLEFSNYADLLPAAMSGGALAVTPLLVSDCSWEICFVYLSSLSFVFVVLAYLYRGVDKTLTFC